MQLAPLRRKSNPAGLAAPVAEPIAPARRERLQEAVDAPAEPGPLEGGPSLAKGSPYCAMFTFGRLTSGGAMMLGSMMSLGLGLFTTAMGGVNCRSETFGEAAVNRPQQRARLLNAMLVSPKPRETRGRS